MPKFIHADLIAQYLEDANECEQPWLRWQYRSSGTGWEDALFPLAFFPDHDYRRKPRTVRIGEFDVPEPAREPLEEGQECWLADVTYGATFKCQWDGKSLKPQWLDAGLIHLTKEAAQIHIDALLSFTKRGE